jgi:hypothetical protein
MFWEKDALHLRIIIAGEAEIQQLYQKGICKKSG